MELFRADFVVNNPEACLLSNREVVRKSLVRIERPLCAQETTCFTNIMYQGSSGTWSHETDQFSFAQSFSAISALSVEQALSG
jgi:hypothetical protein